MLHMELLILSVGMKIIEDGQEEKEEIIIVIGFGMLQTQLGRQYKKCLLVIEF
tara:strand:- start:469 stop:627 length:159 start_codon:yes stop_codon:yes gene_type:complete